MAVYFHSSSSEICAEVGEYQEINITEPPSTSKPKCKHLNAVVLSFGFLCILQAALNISLRLILTEEAKLTASESFTTRVPPALNTTAEVARMCPPEWLMFESRCYFISSQRADFDQSREDCERRGAQLVKLENRREQMLLSRLSAAAWIGMTDRDREGIWVWLDGTLVNRNKLLWAPGQPDDSNGGEDCGDIRNQADFIGLNDSKCSEKKQWICEKSLK